MKKAIKKIEIINYYLTMFTSHTYFFRDA